MGKILKVIDFNHPYTEHGIKNEVMTLDENNITSFIYPEDGLDFSDLCHMYLSMEGLTVCIMEVAPGGFFDPPDIHPGDEAYYVLEGVVTLLNPAIGQSVEVHEGESVLIPKGALHSGYNFGDKTLKVLAVIAPIHKDENMNVNLRGPKKIFKYNPADFSGKSKGFKEPQDYGSIDRLGTWPVSGPELREYGVIYRITEDKKLIVIHGEYRPILMKFSVSNDYMHVGEYILPVGGATTRHSEALLHKGLTFLFGVSGEATVFLPQERKTHVLKQHKGLYLPSNTEYRLLNYSESMAKIVFAISGEL